MRNLNHDYNLEIEQDLSFTRREWAVQRVGWGIMGLLVILALLGVFNSGPLSHATVTSGDEQVSLHYDRFVRSLAPTILQVEVARSRAQQARLWLDSRYLQGVEIQHITPQPQRVEAAAERFIYIFNHTASDQSTRVTFYIQPQAVGRLSGRLGIDNGSALQFSHFVYP